MSSLSKSGTFLSSDEEGSASRRSSSSSEAIGESLRSTSIRKASSATLNDGSDEEECQEVDSGTRTENSINAALRHLNFIDQISVDESNEDSTKTKVPRATDVEKVPKIEKAYLSSNKEYIDKWIEGTTEIQNSRPRPSKFDYNVMVDMPSTLSNERIQETNQWIKSAKEVLRTSSQYDKDDKAAMWKEDQRENNSLHFLGDKAKFPIGVKDMFAKVDMTIPQQLQVLCAMFDIPFPSSKPLSTSESGQKVNEEENLEGEKQYFLGLVDSAHALFSLCLALEASSTQNEENDFLHLNSVHANNASAGLNHALHYSNDDNSTIPSVP